MRPLNPIVLAREAEDHPSNEAQASLPRPPGSAPYLDAPDYARTTYDMLCREWDRKQGMIEDLHQLADDNCGMDPEDCDLLIASVRDRDNLAKAIESLSALYGEPNSD